MILPWNLNEAGDNARASAGRELTLVNEGEEPRGEEEGEGNGMDDRVCLNAWNQTVNQDDTYS